MARLRLLFVEDECDISDVIGLALSLDPAIELHSFASSLEALDAVRSGQIPCQHALLDMRIPGMTGLELHHAIRQLPNMANLQSILITSALECVTDAVLRQPGIAGAIAKPFDALRLAQTVRRLFSAQVVGRPPERIRQASSL